MLRILGYDYWLFKSCTRKILRQFLRAVVVPLGVAVRDARRTSEVGRAPR